MIQKNHFHHVIEFVVGLLFGMGLMLSGMTDPGKVIGFLDLFGRWDPSLALVMGGAIMVGFFAFTVAKKTHHHVLWRRTSLALHHPNRQTSGDRQFVVWRGLGIGWLLSWPCAGVHGRWPTQSAGVCVGHVGRHAGL